MAKRACKAAWLMTFVFFAVGALFSGMRFVPTVGADDAGPNARVDPDDPMFAGRFSGRVTGPDGRPLPGARIFVVPLDRQFNTETTAIDDAARVRAETDADGRFEFDAPDMTYTDIDGLAARRKGLISAGADGYGPDWIFIEERPRSAFAPPAGRIKRNDFSFELAQDDVPIRGRFLGPDGQPLAGARVRSTHVMVPRQRNLDGLLAREANASVISSPPDYERHFYYRPHQIQGLTAETSTDAEGRFTLSGIGRERLAQLTVSAPGVVDTDLTIMTRDAPDFATRRNFNGKATSTIYGAGFTLKLQAGRSISGVVRDRDSHQPIAGILVGIGSENFVPSTPTHRFSTGAGRWRCALHRPHAALGRRGRTHRRRKGQSFERLDLAGPNAYANQSGP
ncbi:MAG TPA: carboxypeptidase-like regulatory domain-containing protein [Pirellulales bacterium]|nr:carboxypeptidase-like regulatory domain-containing protein [Pirellulales bacterium]